MTEPTPQPQPQPSPGPRRLVRRTDDRMIAGVCSGIAAHFGLDVTLVRLLAVLGFVLGLGSIGVAYVIAWVVVPKA